MTQVTLTIFLGSFHHISLSSSANDIGSVVIWHHDIMTCQMTPEPLSYTDKDLEMCLKLRKWPVSGLWHKMFLKCLSVILIPRSCLKKKNVFADYTVLVTGVCGIKYSWLEKKGLVFFVCAKFIKWVLFDLGEVKRDLLEGPTTRFSC